MKLPDDVTRCNGNGDDRCQQCQRRIAPRPELTWMMNPPDEMPCRFVIYAANTAYK